VIIAFPSYPFPTLFPTTFSSAGWYCGGGGSGGGGGGGGGI